MKRLILFFLVALGSVAHAQNYPAPTLPLSGSEIVPCIQLGFYKSCTASELGSGGASVANPTSTIGLSTVNGSATTAMRSDGAPPLSQAIVPTWTGLHTFSAGANITPACPAATSAVGYLGAPQNTQGAYTFVCSDAGKIVECSSSCGTWTIPANSAVAYPIGTIIALDNETSSTIALAINTDTLNYGASTGSQVIPAQTVGTIVKIGTTSWRLNLPAGSVPTGTVAFYAANSAPSGWLIENGAAVSRTTYANLFAVIGTTYGAGDGSTTFNLPNMLGQFVRGFDSSGSVDPGRTFGSTEAYAVGPHNHLNGMTQTTGSGSLMVYGTSTTGIPGSAVDTVHADANTPVNQGYTSTSTGTESRPTNVALTPIIKTAFHPADDKQGRPRLIAA